MDELRNNPQIIELLETLEENGMQKEKGEVSALVSYIGDMEHTLSAMLAEMQEKSFPCGPTGTRKQGRFPFHCEQRSR